MVAMAHLSLIVGRASVRTMSDGADGDQSILSHFAVTTARGVAELSRRSQLCVTLAVVN
jgi:hypothetical protein